ncbi:MAG: PCRF domain-containing protein, partial [Candidatus Acidiferrales bacterium]
MPKNCGVIFDPARLGAELAELDRKVNQPNVWNDPENAQRLLQRRKYLDRMLGTEKKLERHLSDLEALLELSHEGESVADDF